MPAGTGAANEPTGPTAPSGAPSSDTEVPGRRPVSVTSLAPSVVTSTRRAPVRLSHPFAKSGFGDRPSAARETALASWPSHEPLPETSQLQVSANLVGT